MNLARALLLFVMAGWFVVLASRAQDDWDLEDLLDSIAEEALQSEDGKTSTEENADLEKLLAEYDGNDETANEPVDTIYTNGMETLGLDDLLGDKTDVVDSAPADTNGLDDELDDLLSVLVDDPHMSGNESEEEPELDRISGQPIGPGSRIEPDLIDDVDELDLGFHSSEEMAPHSKETGEGTVDAGKDLGIAELVPDKPGQSVEMDLDEDLLGDLDDVLGDVVEDPEEVVEADLDEDLLGGLDDVLGDVVEDPEEVVEADLDEDLLGDLDDVLSDVEDPEEAVEADLDEDLLGDLDDVLSDVEDPEEAVEADLDEDLLGDLDDVLGDVEDPEEAVETDLDEDLLGDLDDVLGDVEDLEEAVETDLDEDLLGDLDEPLHEPSDDLEEIDTRLEEDLLGDLDDILDDNTVDDPEGVVDANLDVDLVGDQELESVLDDDIELDDLFTDPGEEPEVTSSAVGQIMESVDEPVEVSVDELLVVEPDDADLDAMVREATADTGAIDDEFDLDELLAGDEEEGVGEEPAEIRDEAGSEEHRVTDFDDSLEPSPEPSEKAAGEDIEPAVVESETTEQVDGPWSESELNTEDAANIAQEITTEEIIRRRANEIKGMRFIDEGIIDLADKKYESAVERFERALRLISPRPGNEETIKRANWGISEAKHMLARDQFLLGDQVGAEELVVEALRRTPNHRSALRLRQKISKAKTRPTRFDASKQPEIIAEKVQIRDLLLEGREFFSVGKYDLAEQRFDQVRLLDPYNTDALKFLKKLDERRYEITTLERDKSIADMMNEVRKRWNPPIEKDIDVPVPVDSQGPLLQPGNDIEEKMQEIIIPSLEFRNANVIDVINRLRQESVKSDPLGEGINIVLKLDTSGGENVVPGPVALEFGDDPFGDDFNGEFDDVFGDADDGRGENEGFGREGVGSDVAIPKINVNLRRVSLLDALQIITEVADLKFRIDKRAVFILPKRSIDQPLETRIYAVQPSMIEVIVERDNDDGDETRDEFIELGGNTSLKRGDVKAYFEDLGIPFPTGSSISYNSSSSQLIVRNTVENLEVLERLLPNINRPPPQVEIEARFVEVEQTDLEELGLEWILTDNYEFAVRKNGAPVGAQERLQVDANPAGFTSGLRFFETGQLGPEPGSRAADGTAGFVGDVASFSSVLTNPELNLVLHALQQKGSSDLLSAPRVTTRSGVSASIEVVTEIIYPTEFTAESSTTGDLALGAGAGDITINQIEIFPETFETREVGVILNVTPTVGADGFTIDLTMAPEVAELVGWLQYGTASLANPELPRFNIPQPVFASRNVTTSIVVWDGQTVVLGGLIREEVESIDDRIPVLGDLPLIGRLFRTEGERSVKRNLLIFVTARVVDPAGRPVRTGDSYLPSTAISSGSIGSDAGSR